MPFDIIATDLLLIADTGSGSRPNAWVIN